MTDKEQLREAIGKLSNFHFTDSGAEAIYKAAEAHLKLLDEIDSGRYYLSKSGVKGMVDIKEIF